MKNRTARAFLVLVGALCQTHALEPADLDLKLDKFEYGYYRDDFRSLCQALKSGCGIEIGPNGDRPLPHRKLPPRRSSPTVRQILDDVVRPDQKWTIEDGAVNLIPSKKPQTDFLSKRISKLSCNGISGFLAAGHAFGAAGVITTYQIMGRPPQFKPIKLELENVTLRQALNAISKADGEFIWIFAHPNPGGQIKSPNFTVSSWRKEGIPFSVEEKKEFMKVVWGKE